jgi:RNA polymerase sigma-70 factor (ECF subfamily)
MSPASAGGERQQPMRKKVHEQLTGDQWQTVILEDRARYYKLAYSYVKNEQDALDILQESLYRALKSYTRLRDREAVKTWFFRIVINTAINYINKNKRVVYLDDEQWAAIPDQKEHDHLALKEALDALPPKDKTLITLRYFEDMKISDISKLLQENENTVKSRLYSVLKKLNVRMSQE